ncbi:MAG: nitroreductase family protein, partial [Parvibaculaceae bacterium]|nr:nitroreductase family protein [Parvibaculaceae bacterium]
PKIPEWEQVLSVGAVCQNMLLAASALGFGAQWLTEWYSFDDDVNSVLGLREGERMAGYLYFGSMAEKPGERARPSLEERVSRWG